MNIDPDTTVAFPISNINFHEMIPNNFHGMITYYSCNDALSIKRADGFP